MRIRLASSLAPRRAAFLTSLLLAAAFLPPGRAGTFTEYAGTSAPAGQNPDTTTVSTDGSAVAFAANFTDARRAQSENAAPHSSFCSMILDPVGTRLARGDLSGSVKLRPGPGVQAGPAEYVILAAERSTASSVQLTVSASSRCMQIENAPLAG